MKPFIKLFFATLFTCTAASAQDKAAQLDSLFTTLYQQNKFTGNVLIAENGKPVLQKSYGKAFREKDLDLNAETVFELASVSKQFTAMGIMLLKKQNKLSYEDSLRKFFPELPYHNISIRQLLNHTSGLPDYIDLTRKSWDEKKMLTNDDMVKLLVEQKPQPYFAPGEKWEYSNTGYALLASIIEKASGMSFGQYLHKHIFEPLNMKSSRVYRKRYEKTSIPNYAYGYLKDPAGRFVMADSFPATASMVYALDGIYGDGVVNATAGDLLKWDQALYTEKLLSKKELEEAFTPAPLNNGKKFDYGFGWMLKESKQFGKTMNHSGGWPGYSTYIERHPENGKTIILLANGGSANSTLKKIRNILYGIVETPPVEIQVNEKLLQEYVGNYYHVKTDTISVFIENGKLHASGGGQKKHQLKAESKDLFFRDGPDYKSLFIRNEKGEVVQLNIIGEGPLLEAVRLK